MLRMLNKETRIFLITGGWSAERSVSLQTGEAVMQCLEAAGYPVCRFDLSPEEPPGDVVRRMLDQINAFRAEVAYLALHGPFGEDGTLQGILELAGIPYNGSGVLASALGNDKVFAKQVFIASKLATPKCVVIEEDASPPASPLPLPVIVKPCTLGSSLGVSLVEHGDQFSAALAETLSYGQGAMVEQFISGREIQVCIMEGVVLPLIEIRSLNRIYDFEAKYTAGRSEHKVPAPLPKKQYEAAQQLGVAAYRAVGCRGTARVELIAENTGTLYVLEVNTLPGMTMTSLVPEAAREAGLSFLDLVTKQIEQSLEHRAGVRQAAVAK